MDPDSMVLFSLNCRLGRWLRLSISIVVCCLVGSVPISAMAGQIGWLITPDEAALAPPSADQMIRPRGLSSDGPGIEIVKPEDGESIPSPAELLIRFIPKTGSIDLASLKVTLLKFISIDLTDRLRPYVNSDGIAMKDAKVPAGSYRVRISLADTAGKVSSRELSFEVR